MKREARSTKHGASRASTKPEARLAALGHEAGDAAGRHASFRFVLRASRSVLEQSDMSAAILAAVSGALLALSLPPFNVEWLGWLALAPLLLAARERRALEALGLGLLAGLVSGVIHVGWHEDLHALHFAYLPYLWLAMLIGVVAACSSLCSVLRAKRGQSSLRWVAFVACAGVAAEWLTTFSPLPLNLALCQYQQRAILQIAAFTGIWGVSFLLWWSNAAVASAIAARRPLTAPVAVTLAALALTLGYAHLALRSSSVLRAPRSVLRGTAFQHGARSTERGAVLLRVAAIQEHSGGETASVLRTASSESDEGDRDALTRRAAARGARLVVWSEDCLGSAFAPGGSGDATADLARELKAHLVVGYSEPGPLKSFNCAALVAPDGSVQGVHRKIHLFFGERQIREPGRAVRVFDSALGRVGLEICYDNCYTDITRRLVQAGAQIIAMPNYDPPTPRGVLHHLHAAVLPFRAVENRVPIVRADANGCSQIVDATGRLIGEAPLYAPDALVGDVMLGDGAGTVFTRLGDWLAYASLLVVAVCLVKGSSRLSALRSRPDKSAG
jgi:apolipoprotein N-acyltransferase